MRSAILLGSFFIGHSLMRITDPVIPMIAGVLISAFLWDLAETLHNLGRK